MEVQVDLVLKPLSTVQVGDKLHVCCCAQSLILKIESGTTAAALARTVHEDTDLCEYCSKRFGLFDPIQQKYLAPTVAIASLNTKRLEFRDKIRLCHFTFLDGSTSVVRIDESLPTKKVLMQLAFTLKIKAFDSLGLVVMSDYRLPQHMLANANAEHTGNPTVSTFVNSKDRNYRKAEPTTPEPKPRSWMSIKRSPRLSKEASSPKRPHRRGTKWEKSPARGVSSRQTKKIKNKLQETKAAPVVRMNVPWLDGDKQLPEQGVEPDDQLLLQQRFFQKIPYKDANAGEKALIFAHARMSYLSGQLLCAGDQIVLLSAFLLQLRYGDKSRGWLTDKVLKAERAYCIPAKKKLKKKFLTQLKAEYAKLHGKSSEEVRNAFLQKWREAEEDGYDIFSCEVANIKGKDRGQGFIGVSPKDVILATKKDLISLPLKDLVQWSLDESKVHISFGSTKWQLSMVEFGEALIETISQLKTQQTEDSLKPSDNSGWLLKRPSFAYIKRTSSKALLDSRRSVNELLKQPFLLQVNEDEDDYIG